MPPRTHPALSVIDEASAGPMSGSVSKLKPSLRASGRVFEASNRHRQFIFQVGEPGPHQGGGWDGLADAGDILGRVGWLLTASPSNRGIFVYWFLPLVASAQQRVASLALAQEKPRAAGPRRLTAT